MSAHGYIPLVKQYIHQRLPKEHVPALLEVGVDRGVMWLTLLTFLARTRQQFIAVGVDVLVQEQVQLMLAHLDRAEQQQAYLIEGNSLEVLPKMVEQGMKFDVLLLDGDHNYHTVSQELTHLEALTHPHAIVIVDDVFGRWSERDLFYAEREGYENIKTATQRVDTEKHGVKVAVDEWIEMNPNWQLSQPIAGEAVLLMRKHA